MPFVTDWDRKQDFSRGFFCFTTPSTIVWKAAATKAAKRAYAYAVQIAAHNDAAVIYARKNQASSVCFFSLGKLGKAMRVRAGERAKGLENNAAGVVIKAW